MSAFAFRPAVRQNVNLLIGLAGGTGSGKTYTAMRLASGMAGENRFCVIDTESGRASHYADQFKFDVGELRPPFTPEAYTEAIKAAVAAGYTVIVVDSMSHEYAGEGGVLDMQEAEFERMGSRDGVKVASWIKPKGAHKRMMQYLLQVRAHLILCFRAEPKIEIAKDEKGKTIIVPKQSLVGLDGWIPVTEKNVPFELTVSLLFTADAPGVPKPIKLQEQHRALFPLNETVNEESGRRIAQWAAGAIPDTRIEGVEYISEKQVADLEVLCVNEGIATSRVLVKAGVDKIANIKLVDYDRAIKFVQAIIAKKRETAA